MKKTHGHVEPAPFPFWPAATFGDAQQARPCATPHCHGSVTEPWEETGKLCASCAIEGDLADRLGRWDRLPETIH